MRVLDAYTRPGRAVQRARLALALAGHRVATATHKSAHFVRLALTAASRTSSCGSSRHMLTSAILLGKAKPPPKK